MFKLNFNRFFFKNKLPFKKNFFFKNKLYYNNKNLILNSLLFKNKKEFFFNYKYKNKKFSYNIFLYFLIKNLSKSSKKFLLLKKKKSNFIFYKILKSNCSCFYYNYIFKIKAFVVFGKKRFNLKKRLKKKYKINLNNYKNIDNLSFLILFNRKINFIKTDFFNFKKKYFFMKKNKPIFTKKIKKNLFFKNIFKNSFQNKFKMNLYYNNVNYIYFVKTLNIDKIFNKPYVNNTFISFNFIKYYSNQRLVKQPICILNYKLTSKYNSNNSTRVFKSYILSRNTNINYHVFLKKFYFNLKKTSYKFFGLNQTFHFFNFLYKTHFKMFV